MAKEKNEAPAEPEKISFHAAVLHADGSFGVESFPTLEELAARIKALIDKDVTVFAFSGDRLHVSKPPFRHLLIPGGEPVPLFDMPQSLEPDDTGYLGVDPINLQGPPEIKSAQPGRPTSTPDEFFGDDDHGGDVMGVFDSVLPDPDS
jgi:hypothetical protein